MNQNEVAVNWSEQGSKLNGKINNEIGENNIDKLKDEALSSVKKHDEIPEMPNGHGDSDIIRKDEKPQELESTNSVITETDKEAEKVNNVEKMETEESPKKPEVESEKENSQVENSTTEESPKTEEQDSKESEDVKTEEPKVEENPEMEVDKDNEEQEEEEDEVCECKPSCHSRLIKITNQIELTTTHLEDYIKLKKQDSTNDLTNLVRVFNDINAYAQKSLASIKHLNGPFYTEEPQGTRKRKSRGKAYVETNNAQETPEKKKEKKIDIKSFEPLTEDTFKSLKGLAVFAKWPNSGWYYPGIIEGLDTSDWKEETNVKVKFYDGLVREMKNINILPAYLIPVDCIVCDLDDETEMLVVSSNCIENNNVEFTLCPKSNKDAKFDLGFNKLAIRAVHMKNIKQQLEPNTDVSAKKMHMVSLDNLVSGRRSRGRLNKEDGDESGNEATPIPRKGTRKSVRKSEDAKDEESNQEDESTPAESTPAKATKRRSSNSDNAGPPAKRSTTSSKRSK